MSSTQENQRQSDICNICAVSSPLHMGLGERDSSTIIDAERNALKCHHCTTVAKNRKNRKLFFKNIYLKIIKNQKMNLPMNLPMNLYPLLPTIHQNSMECEDITYCRKIRIYPSTKQKEYFETFFGASRYIYNKTIDWKKKIMMKNHYLYLKLDHI